MGAALSWLAAEQDVDRSLRLALAFESIYLFREAGGVGRLLETALSIPGALEHPLAPRALASAANRSISRGESPLTAYTQAKASLDLARELGVEVGIHHRLNIAATYMRSGHLEEARENALAAIELSSDEPLHATRSYVLLCALERWRGDVPAAQAAADAAEEAARRAGQPFDLAYALLVKGYAYEEAEPVAALAMYHEATRIGEERLPGGMSLVCYALANAARVHARLGQIDDMVSDLDRAVTLAAANGSREEYGTVLAIAGMSLLMVGATVEAATIFSAATQVFPVENLAMSVGVTVEDMQARLVEAIGDDALAAAWETGRSMSDREARDYALTALARVRDSAAA